MPGRDRVKRHKNREQMKIINSSNFSREELIVKERELFNIDCPGTVYIESPFLFDYGTNIHFSGNFYANMGCSFFDTGDIYFGKNVVVSPNVKIYTATHPIDAHGRLTRGHYILSVKVGDNVWIGGGATINPGVTIGENCVIGSGSVVTKSVPANSFVAGNPARVVKNIDNAEYYDSKKIN